MLATTLLASAQDLQPAAVLCGIPRRDAVIHVDVPTNDRPGRDPRLPRPVTCGTRLTRCKVLDPSFVLGQHTTGRRVCRKCATRVPVASARAARPGLDTVDALADRFDGLTVEHIAADAAMAATEAELRACSLAIDVLGYSRAARAVAGPTGTYDLTAWISRRIDELNGSPNAQSRAARGAETRGAWQLERRARSIARRERKQAVTAFAL